MWMGRASHWIKCMSSVITAVPSIISTQYIIDADRAGFMDSALSAPNMDCVEMTEIPYVMVSLIILSFCVETSGTYENKFTSKMGR